MKLRFADVAEAIEEHLSITQTPCIPFWHVSSAEQPALNMLKPITEVIRCQTVSLHILVNA